MLRRLLDRLRDRVGELRALRRRPVFALYFQRVRASVIAMTAHVIFMTWALEPLLRWLMPPPSRPSGLLAIFSGPVPPPPHLEVLRWLDPVLWALGWAGFCIFLDRSIKPALARARDKSRELAAAAQKKLSQGEVVGGLTLLAEAAELAPDQAERSQLQATLLQVESTLAPAARASLPGRARTALVAASDAATGTGGEPGGTVAFGSTSGGTSDVPVPTGGTAAESAAGGTAVLDGSASPGPGAPGGVRQTRTMAHGRITLDSQLGAGAMGRVFAATDRLLGRRLAIKELVEGISENPEHRDRFLREAQVLARLSHPNVVQIYDLITEEDRSYLCMELVEGTSLEAVLADSGKLAVAEAAAIGEQIASALAYAHERGVVHRDLKPANVICTPDGTVKVVDFGVARLADAKMTRTGMLIGTPVYMSPEQIRGDAAEAPSDLYALGVLLYELVAGRPPFDGNIATLLNRHLTQVAPALDLPGDAGATLAELVADLLRKEPGERPQTAAEVAARLAGVRTAAAA